MQSDKENQCRNNTVWNLECQQLGHLFLFSSNTQQPFMLEQGKTDSGLGIWSGRSLTNDEKIFSGLNGEMFYALCSPPANLKMKEKILTTKALERNCVDTTVTDKSFQNEMSQQQLIDHLDKRKCPPALKSSKFKEGNSMNSTQRVPVIDIFLNPARALDLKEVQDWVAQKLKRKNRFTQVNQLNWGFRHLQSSWQSLTAQHLNLFNCRRSWKNLTPKSFVFSGTQRHLVHLPKPSITIHECWGTNSKIQSLLWFWTNFVLHFSLSWHSQYFRQLSIYQNSKSSVLCRYQSIQAMFMEVVLCNIAHLRHSAFISAHIFSLSSV